MLELNLGPATEAASISRDVGPQSPQALVKVIGRLRSSVELYQLATAESGTDLVERDDFSSNRHFALSFCLSMIFPENRCTLIRIML